MQLPNITVIHPACVPIATQLCRVAKIRETINHMVQWREANARISPGLLLETLIICILCDRKPLWKVEQFWAKQDLAFLFPDTGIELSWLNDDAYGHALDKLAEIEPAQLISIVSLTLLAAHDLGITKIHLDTTSKSVQGTYDRENRPDFSVCYGFSKDKRPDLKQFKFGLGVQQNGLPVAGEVLSGNTSDALWNPTATMEMQSFFANKGFRDVLFVSDCALISTNSLRDLARKHIRFISRLPETFSLAGELKHRALTDCIWQEIGSLASQAAPEAARYKTASFKETLDGRTYRFLVVHSTALEAKKEKTLVRQAACRREQWEKEAGKLASISFVCEADARQAMEKLVGSIEGDGFHCQGSVREETRTTYARRGRPKEGEIPSTTTVYRAEVHVGDMEEAAWQDWKMKESLFVLISTEHKMSDAELLQEYKQQNSVETRFRVLKMPVYLGEVYLKNERRIQALGYVFLLVLLLASYLEYRVRKSLKDRGEGVRLPGNKQTATPSLATIFEVLEPIQVVIVGGVRCFPDNLQTQARNMIIWTGFDPEIYLRPIAMSPE